MRPNRIRVVIVEADPRLLDCLQLEISNAQSLRCVGGFGRFDTAIQSIAKNDSDVVLMDLSLPDMDGIEAIAFIKDNWPRLKVVVFSGDEENQTVYSAFQAGANGFLLKSAPKAELVDGIEKAYSGGAPMSPAINAKLVAFFHGRRSLAPRLSPTEKVILTEYDRGTPQKQIADMLGMSLGTLFTHRNRILEKSGVTSLVRASYLLRLAGKT